MAELTGKRIVECVRDGSIEIDPFDESLVNPNSIDVRLGNLVTVYQRFAEIVDSEITNVKPLACVIDVKVPERVQEPYEIDAEGFVLWPGVLYLMHTEENICAHEHRPHIEGKSSMGRLGVFVHVTAGKGENGFFGQYTLEVLSTYPTRVYAGMRIAQMSFETLDGERTDYQQVGSYKRGELSLGPVASRIWKQFERK